ncbi:MAG: outer membrane lipoprotein carrier protein LolA [Bacteroidetes bacterium]|nr:outer membrane lipoprotein carrier protein LolA [Bacteroidota bacterium]
MKHLLYILLCACTFNVFAQDQDPKAKTILDDLSKVTKAYKTISADYAFTIFNKDKKQVEKQTGKVQVKGQKFKLEIPGSNIVCDGKTIWTHNKDAGEVTIKNFEVNNDEQLNPSKIFTLYETGYKYKFDKEEKIGATMCNVIDLYPTVKPEKKKFHTIKIYIDKAKKQVVQLKMLMKDGGSQLYEIKTFKPNLELADALFVFDTKAFKPDQIIDERD